MGKKSDIREARIAAARKRCVLPVLLGINVVLEEAWLRAGTRDRGIDYPALEMSDEDRERVKGKWEQIRRWRLAVVEKNAEILKAWKASSALWNDMKDKHSLIEAAIDKYSPNGITYNNTLAVQTIVLSFLTDDWGEEQEWNVPREYIWYRRTLQTLGQWMCPPGDAINLLANMVYYDTRDKILEHPDWSKMWVDEPISETEEWIAAHPEDEFSKAAQLWCKQTFGREVRTA